MTSIVRGVLVAVSLACLLAVVMVSMDLGDTTEVDLASESDQRRWLKSEPLSIRPLSAELVERIEQIGASQPKLDPNASLSEADIQRLQEQQIAAQKAAYKELQPLVELLLKRNRRHVTSRLVNAQAKLLNEDVDGFVADYVRLFDLERSNKVELATSLAAQSSDTRILNAVVPYLRTSPDWGRTYLETIRREGIQPAVRLVNHYKYYPANHRVFFETLIREGYLDQAYLAFFQYLGDDATEFLSIPYDPEFLGYPGAAPFNWLYPNDIASRRPNGGAEVVYTRERNILLYQIFPLSPGDYDIRAEMTGAASSSRGYFAWEILCLPEGNLITRHTIESLSTTPETISFPVDIPRRGCSYQTLRLVGQPGSFPRPVYAEISKVEIARRTTGSEDNE